MNPQYLKVVAGNGHAPQSLGAAWCDQVVANSGVAGNVLKQVVVFLELKKLPHVEPSFLELRFVAFDELHDALGVGKRQWPQQNTINDGEDRGVRSEERRVGKEC